MVKLQYHQGTKYPNHTGNDDRHLHDITTLLLIFHYELFIKYGNLSLKTLKRQRPLTAFRLNFTTDLLKMEFDSGAK